METPNIETITNEIQSLFCSSLNLSASQVEVTENLRELPGIESIKVLRIVAKIEKKYDIELDDDVVFRTNTIEEIAQAVTRLLRDSP
jgi:acyl carrier protein